MWYYPPLHDHARYDIADIGFLVPQYAMRSDFWMKRWRMYHKRLCDFHRWSARRSRLAFYDSITPPSADMVQLELF